MPPLFELNDSVDAITLLTLLFMLVWFGALWLGKFIIRADGKR